MGKRHHHDKCCKNPCEPVGYHVHNYCAYTLVDDCHRHLIRGVTKPAPNIPCHKHDYEGETSCNNCHTHCYSGTTCETEPVRCGHVHNFSGKTACADGHLHHYCGTTEQDKTYSERSRCYR